MDIQIKIKNVLNNNIFLLDVNKSNCINNIKNKIQDKFNIDKRSIRLLYNGYPMLDDYFVYQYDLDNNSVLDLIIQIY